MSPPATGGTHRRAAVLGSPIAHSKSPQLHLAAYRALGLPDWTYDRIECTAEQLPGVVGAMGPEWVGVSVTMPGKFAALEFADERTQRAELVGSANTLLHRNGGWRADNTDVDGVVGALATARPGEPADFAEVVVVGAGGTARAAVVAASRVGARRVTVVARDAAKAAPLLELAGATGVPARHCPFTEVGLREEIAVADALISTVPASAAAAYTGVLDRAPVLLDAVYNPWPTPLAAAVAAAGGTVISGLQMLLHQAFAQVEQFTGRPAPKEVMAAALG